MKWKASVLVLVVFLLGIALGGLGVHLYQGKHVSAGPPPAPLPKTSDEVVQQLDAKCSLTADQQKQIRAIMDDVMAQYREIYEPIRPKIEEVRQAGRQRIRAILTPEQLPRFDAYLRWMDEERKKQEH
jgi:Spy/CpxP family protein refolding chaperone